MSHIKQPTVPPSPLVRCKVTQGAALLWFQESSTGQDSGGGDGGGNDYDDGDDDDTAIQNSNRF